MLVNPDETSPRSRAYETISRKRSNLEARLSDKIKHSPNLLSARLTVESRKPPFPRATPKSTELQSLSTNETIRFPVQNYSPPSSAASTRPRERATERGPRRDRRKSIAQAARASAKQRARNAGLSRLEYQARYLAIRRSR